MTLKNRVYKRSAKTGTADAADAIDGAVLIEGDLIIVEEAGTIYEYVADLTSGAVADGLTIIEPTTNPGTVRLILQKQSPSALPAATTDAVGGVELSTGAETITGSDAVRAVTPSGLTSKIDTDGAMAGNADTRIPSQKAAKTYADLKLAKASNLSDVANAATAFGNIKQAAATTATGVSERATVTEGIAGTDAERHMTPETTAAAIEANAQWYGVSYNETGDSYLRRGSLLGVAVGSSPGDDYLPIQRQMKRCILSDAGVVQYYMEPGDSYNRLGDEPTVTGTDDAGTASKLSDAGVFTAAASAYVGHYVHNTTDDTYALITAKDSDDVLSISADIMDSGETFEICTAVLDGTDGQVMTEVPKFYRRYAWSSPTHSWDISFQPLPGFEVHPAFVKAGVEVDYRYVGAYEAYKDGSNVLSSESGRTATGTATRANFRTYAEARGSGWHQLDFNLMSALQLLYLIEYADFDSQTMISRGNTRYAAWPGVLWATGLSNGDGNASGGASTAGGAVTDYMTYRGVENWFGSMWQFPDGINVHNSSANGSRAYVADDWQDFADDTDTDHDLITSDLAQTNGYARTLCPVEAGFLPKTVSGGSATTGLADYYYTYFNDDPDSGWRVCLVGGAAYTGLLAGAFYVYTTHLSSISDAHFGGRLCF